MSFKLLHIVAVASLTAGLSGLPSSVMAQVPPPVIGMRGVGSQKFGGVSYDVFLGTPVYKPEQFNTAGVTAGMQVVYQY